MKIEETFPSAQEDAFSHACKGARFLPGGYGTLEELFETLTLIQTTKIKPIPVLIFGRKFRERIINF